MFSRWFGKKRANEGAASTGGPAGPRVPRHSGGWSALRKRLAVDDGLRVVDVGFTSPANINCLTNLGHSVFLADLVHDAWTGNWQTGVDEKGQPVWDVEGYLNHSLQFSARMFDVVLLWTTLDYLPEPFVVPVVSRLFDAMNRGGQVLAFFHTRTHGEETDYSRFHITAGDDVEVQAAKSFAIQRTFSNRSIEKLFANWAGHKQFLAKDSVSEVIITR